MNDPHASPKIMIGLPAFNEERTVASIVLQAREITDVVVVVNDGSSDRTEKLAKLAGAEVVCHETNMGYGSAIKTILAEAVKKDVDVLVIIDADAQNNPGEIPSLIEAVQKGADIAIGSRKMQRDATPAYRWAGQKVLAKFTNIAARQNLSDTESGFRAYSRQAIRKLKLRESGMAISAEMISEASRLGLTIEEVPITITYEDAKPSKNPVIHGLSNLGRIFVFISEIRPLLFFSVIGGLFIAVALGAGIWVAQSYYTSYTLATGTALVAMLLTMIGIFSIFTGIILNVLIKYLNR
ncbi:MAG: glycosyltransferase family 2 protein [Dehalococcoidales bacterium]|nr:glycosyltransferase family 2 protein [Dehalococcoidales bacterium]